MSKKKAKEDALLQYQKGKRFIDVGDFDSALKPLLFAQQFFKQSKEYAIYADICRLLGELFFNKGNYIESRNFYKKAYFSFKTYGNKIGMADCYDQIALSFLLQDELKHAEDYQLRALKIRNDTPDKKGQARALKNLAVITYKKNGSADKALPLLEEALSLAQKSKDPRLVVSIALNHSKIASKKGDFSSAMKSFIVARRFSKKYAIPLTQEDDKDFGTLLLNLGLQKYDEGDLQNSLNYLKKAVVILQAYNDPLLPSIKQTITKIEKLLS